jgi:cation diffusion facilitator family transporter
MSGPSTAESNWPAKRRVTLVGVAVNSILAVGKIIGGVVGQSQALIADGIHSISDLASDALVLVAARWGSLSADHNHPYGHARIETAATAVIGVMLIVVAAGFAFDSIQRLIADGDLPAPGRLALAAAVMSVILNEGLFRYTLHVGRVTGSKMIQANAWHSRSDALSSLVVIIGVLGAMAGVVWLDLVAAVVVAAMVGQMGWRFLAASVAELVDTGLTEERKAALNALIESVPGVRDHQQLRTRQMGGRVLMDVEILLDPELSLARADAIARDLEQRLLQEVNELEDVIVRMRPCDPRKTRD